jgi:hypothetical protein
MAEDLPGPPGSGNRDERPGQQPTAPRAAPPSPHPPTVSRRMTSSLQGTGRRSHGPTPNSPGYGQPGYGYPPGPHTEGLATAALVIAIVGFFICLPIGAVVALVMANSATRRIEASGGRLTGLDQARAARIIAIVELVLVGILVVVGAVIAVSTNSSPTYAPAP